MRMTITRAITSASRTQGSRRSRSTPDRVDPRVDVQRPHHLAPRRAAVFIGRDRVEGVLALEAEEVVERISIDSVRLHPTVVVHD
jgi:hypothetical protein